MQSLYSGIKARHELNVRFAWTWTLQSPLVVLPFCGIKSGHAYSPQYHVYGTTGNTVGVAGVSEPDLGGHTSRFLWPITKH